MKDILNDLLETVALALLLFFVVQGTFRNYRVELSSMEASLFPQDRLVVNKLVYFRLSTEILIPYLTQMIPRLNLMIYFFSRHPNEER